jgi:4-hydroxybenzoate polyprenyltransferase
LSNLLHYAFRISRFRFWIYTAGTYVVGYALGMSTWLDFFNPWYIIYLIYFFLPANIFIYGVNDYWDQATDELNPKKDEKELRMTVKDKKNLLLLIYLVTGISIILLIFQADIVERLIFISFLFLSYFYSAKPLRFKAVPVLDFISNMLYIVPGIFGYYLIARSLPPILFVFAGFLHISAMHLFSAIPDIEFDKKAGLKTTAILLDKYKSLILVLIEWICLAAIVLYLTNLYPLSFLVLIYPIIPLSLLIKRDLDINRVYWTLPYINVSLGGLLFVMLVLATI